MTTRSATGLASCLSSLRLDLSRRVHCLPELPLRALGAPAKPSSEQLNDYHLVRWSENGMGYAAVSDLNQQELSNFADLIRTR